MMISESRESPRVDKDVKREKTLDDSQKKIEKSMLFKEST